MSSIYTKQKLCGMIKINAVFFFEIAGFVLLFLVVAGYETFLRSAIEKN